MKQFFARRRAQWREFYHHSSIQFILSLGFTAVSVVGTVFLGITLYSQFYASSNAQSVRNTQYILNQVNLNVSSYFNRIMRLSDSLCYEVLKSDRSEEEMYSSIDLLYRSHRDAITSISLFSEDGDLLYATPLSILKSNVDPQDADWFTNAMTSTDLFHSSIPVVQILFENPDNDYRWVVPLSRYVDLNLKGHSLGGVLLIDIDYSGIEQICKEVQLPNGGYFYLMNKSGEIIYHPKQQLLHAGLATENNMTAVTYADGSHQESFDLSQREVVVKTVGYFGWKLVAVMPMSQLGSNTADLNLFFFFVLLFSVFLLVFLNLYMSEKISDPIKDLNQAVKDLEGGKANQLVPTDGPYEIGNLGRSISSMVDTLHQLSDDIVAQEKARRRTDLDVLHAQINPHFLYNTLDSVIRMIELEYNQEAVVMVASLASLFRISLSRGKNIIPIASELDHARHYLTIQQMRYKDKFVADITCDDGLEGLYTAKLIVQPLLENAIYHGMAYAEEGEGIIHVHAHRDGDDVVIDVQDNGSGMPKEMVSALLSAPDTGPRTKGSGVGVKNVHQRIQLTFGSQYGLTIASELDVGTQVQIRVPILTQEQAQALETEVEP